MALQKTIAISFLMMSLCGVSMAPVYQAGDSAGWTRMGQVDSKDWAANKSFHVGDTVVFNYNSQFHNVKQVTQQGFEPCNATFLIATYTSGSDGVTFSIKFVHVTLSLIDLNGEASLFPCSQVVIRSNT
jgi:hypothetical protein|uniref:Phytocyanin domain-containing protein n=1 Tax=Populus trichocarpa TaxID=3694 RepID=B9II32_POPTR